MIDFILGLDPIFQVIIATLFTWGMTALGAALVFTTKTFNQKFLDGMLGFAGGVMIAASFWSLLSPALEMAETRSLPAWLPVSIGFLLGGAFIASIFSIFKEKWYIHKKPDKGNQSRKAK